MAEKTELTGLLLAGAGILIGFLVKVLYDYIKKDATDRDKDIMSFKKEVVTKMEEGFDKVADKLEKVIHKLANHEAGFIVMKNENEHIEKRLESVEQDIEGVQDDVKELQRLVKGGG